MWTNILPYPVRWTASYSPRWAGLSPSHTSPCTRPQTLPAHFGWKNKNARTHTHRLLNLWHCINLHLFPNQNSQLQNQSWRRHFNMNAKSISQKRGLFSEVLVLWNSFLPSSLLNTVSLNSLPSNVHQSHSPPPSSYLFPHTKPESNTWYQNQVWFIQPKHINAVRIWYSAVFKKWIRKEWEEHVSNARQEG